jgi:hypothetical protein
MDFLTNADISMQIYLFRHMNADIDFFGSCCSSCSFKLGLAERLIVPVNVQQLMPTPIADSI